MLYSALEGWSPVTRRLWAGHWSWGASWGPLGPSWGRLGRLLRRLAGVLDALGPLGGLLGPLGGVLESPRGFLGSVGDKAKMERSQENQLGSIKMKKWHCFLGVFFENGEQHYHLGAKVEKGVSWEALGAPRDAFGTPWGKKTLPNTTEI